MRHDSDHLGEDGRGPHHDHGGGRGRGRGEGRRGGGRGDGGRRGGGRRGGQRGDVRAAILSLLAERPMHGYEMLSELEERTGGMWRPSPGSLYPALQLLEDQGLVRSADDGGRRRFELTDTGRAGQAGTAGGPAPWEAIVGAADAAEVSLHNVLRQVTVAVDQVAEVGSTAQKAAAETMLTELRRQLYLLLADPAASPSPAAAVARPDRETWQQVEDYLDGALLPWDSDLERALRESQLAGLPGINVSPSQGKLLYLLAARTGSQRILEVGTLGGYSTIWLARALPAGGQVVSLELDDHHAQVARANVANAGLADRVDIRTGPALDSLEALSSAGEAPFDLVFIDADKESGPEYFSWAMRLTRPGSLVIVDNVVRRGRIIEPGSTSPDTLGNRRLIAAMAAEPRIDVTAVQTVGSKGYDGLAIGVVTGTDPAQP